MTGVDIIKLYDICPEAQQQGIADSEVTAVTDNTAKVISGCI